TGPALLFQSLHQEPCYPRAFLLDKHSDVALGYHVTCVAVWPFSTPKDTSFFLAGYSNGKVALFSFAHSAPVHTWSLEKSVAQLVWSPHRPSVFVALETGGKVHLWDLRDVMSDPIYDMRVSPSTTSVALSSVEKSTSSVLVFGDAAGRVGYCDLDSSLLKTLSS
ncbi:hypothetical protein HDU91_003297, partial [Kappamyces sp. JEL0680]